MAFVYWSQLKSMLIKDQLIRKRHWISSLFEFLLPILLVLLHVWFLDDQGTTHLSTSDAPKSNVVKQNSPPLKYSSDVYFSQTFYCNSFGSHIYYTSPNDAASKLLPPKFAACSLRTVSLANDSAVIKAWGDAVDERFRNANSAVFFHELDVDKGIANYTIGGLAIEYGGPYSEPVLNTYQDYIRTQSVVNILMANYPDLASLKESNLEYVYTSKLFNEGNPSDGKEMDPDTKPASQSTFQIDIFNYLEAYAFLEIGLIYLSSIITRRLIREKVTNSKELLRIMGLSDLVYWISHFINYLSLSIFHATFITIIYSVFRTRNPYGNWNASLFWFNYLITSISNILFSFTFTTVLNRPIIGVLLVIVGRAGLAYAPIAASTSTVKLLYISPKVWSCLLPCGQLHFSIYDMFYFGASVKGLSWSNIFQSIESPETLLLGYIYLTALVSWFVYSLLIWYLDAVWPWQSGTPKPWHFPVSSFFNKPIGDIEMNGSTTPDSNDLNGNTNIRYEPEPPLLKPSVKCINLYKSFGSTGGKKFAVNGLNLNILKGQITVLLGHNGAGKTTTMSMITGMLKPSAGKVLVNGIDLHQDTVAARRCLALCPQTDLLFEELTVTENLELVTGLRGLSREVKKQLIPLNIERVNLTDKTDTLACNLSGGMRRRLQLALALSTASETLILDEPTSGLDPESRRQLWNLLLELRKDLSILLTTHFMEEADALGDRIVIMSSGEIKCSGSPMFLKHRFGTGNSIRIAKNVSTFNQDSLLDTMKAHFPNAVATNETNEEIVYQLSSGIKSTADISTATLAQLCDSLDENLNSLGITSYGISVTTLEDVFLKVSEDDGESEQTRVQMEDKLFELNKILGYQRLNGLPLFLQRMKGLLMKRVNYTKRHYKTIGFTIILPVIVLLFTFLTAKSTTYSFMPSQELDYPYPIELNLKSIYGPNAKAVIRATFKKNVPFIKAYNEIMEKAGVEVINIPVSLSLNEYMKTSNQSANEFMRDNIFGLIEDSSKLSGFALWFNPRVALSLPLTIDAWTNTLIRLNGNEMSKVTTTIMAMPNRGTNEPFVASSISQIVSAIFAPIAFALISCSYFLFPSIEAQNKANLIQRMSGIKAPIFWFSHLVFDFSYHIIVSIIILMTITVVDQFIFTSVKAFGSIFLLLLLHGLSSIPLFYIFSLLPMNTDRGFSLLTTISLVCTLVGSALAASLVSFGKIKSVHVVLGDLFPPFAMSFGLSKVYGAAKLHSECARINACDPGNTVSRRLCCNEDVELISFNPFKWTKDGILVEILMLTLDWIIYTAILIVLDVNLHRLIYWYDTVKKKLSEASETQGVVEDEDVIAEKHRVQQLIQSQKIDSEALVVNELSKDFGSFRAVDKVNFAVHKAECFGLLGINGAGKTTTFRMLTGDAMVTQGDAFIESYSLRNDLQNFQQSISYCPQFDALIDNLTPQETLTLFARIRGMPESKVKDNVNYIITSTDLTNFAKTCNQNLSGGNKRKLSLAIASIARPKVMFLDEPTTGVDPSSRRKIWSTLMHLRDTSGSSIVLTSHSMDECEALCSRIGIMARGNFKCLGSTQHLKEKFGQGFTLIVKINQEALKKEDEIDRIKQFIKDEFPSSILRDFHQTILHYHITDTSSRWGDMLRSLDHGKGALMIEDFTLSGTTLEQIFLSFAKES